MSALRKIARRVAVQQERYVMGQAFAQIAADPARDLPPRARRRGPETKRRFKQAQALQAAAEEAAPQ